MGRALALATVALVAGSLTALGAVGAAAQDDDPLEVLRGEIPEGFEGLDDIDEEDARFLRIAEQVGLSTDVESFGDGSSLAGQCGGYAYSFDQDGRMIDAAIAPGGGAPLVDLRGGGQAFTAGNPFKVHTQGIVQYYGFLPRTPPGPEDHSWTVKVAGVSVDKGGDPNPQGKNRAIGIVDLAEDLPVAFNAKVEVSGDLSSENGLSCIGMGHVQFVADGINPLQVGSIAMLAGGIVGLLFNARPAFTYRG